MKPDKNKYFLLAAGIAIIIIFAIIIRLINVHTSEQHGRLYITTVDVTNEAGQETDDGATSMLTLTPTLTPTPTPLPTQTSKAAPVLDTTSEPEALLREIDNAMSNYNYVTLLTHAEGGNLNDPIGIVFTDAEIIRATVLASEPDGRIDGNFRIDSGRLVYDANVETGPNGNGFHGLSVSEQEVEQNCRNLFGTQAQLAELQTEVKCPVYDAVRYIESSVTYPLIVDTEVETELSYESHKYEVVETDNGYIGEVEIYWGYWGTLKREPELSNYMVTYELRLDDSSKYGMVISSMRLSKIGDSDTLPGNSDTIGMDEGITEDAITEVENKPFYGIWCFASKDLQEAQQFADELKKIGFNAKIYISSEWSNLNQEMWYCVSADTCSTESEAESVLRAAYSSGYSDAYIKYSGDYIG